MKISFDISGLSELNSSINRLKIDVIGATKKGMLAEAQEIMDESVSQVPRETDALLNSAFVELDGDGNVIFGYGGDHAQTNSKTGKSVNDYMVAVHERQDLSHPVGKSKFLEDPVNAHKVKIESSLISKIRGFFHF